MNEIQNILRPAIGHIVAVQHVYRLAGGHKGPRGQHVFGNAGVPVRTGAQDKIGIGAVAGGALSAAELIDRFRVNHLGQFQTVFFAGGNHIGSDRNRIHPAWAPGTYYVKKIDDKQIRVMAKQLKKLVLSETCVCQPVVYNKIINQFDNSNVVKAICHNDSLTKLINKVKNQHYKVILDQFVARNNYYKYLWLR